MKMKKIPLIALGLLLPLLVLAQQPLTGSVVDDNGEPL